MYNPNRFSKLLARYAFHIRYLSRTASGPVRVRFAPSPTGEMHIGGLRTALYNYFYARQNSGRFILRLEDTDQSRLVPGAAAQIQDDLAWLGLRIDEGPQIGGPHAPYTQSERLHIYAKYIHQLLKSGHAYYCFCTEKRLDLLRKEAIRNRQIAKYDNRCRTLKHDEANMRINKGDPCCIRFKLNGDDDCASFDDLIYGKIKYDIRLNEGDPIIVKSDGFPTYHIANVIDDHLMEISHVLRGVEWQISTTKHLMIYKAFGWKPPIFGHLPLLVDANGNKLSKRNKDTRLGQYRQDGIFPNALINFVTTSGGGFIDDIDRGIKPKSYNMSQLILRFNIGAIKSSPGKFDLDRLLEYNRLELENLVKDENSRLNLVKSLQVMVKQHFMGKTDNLLQLHNEHVDMIVRWSLNRITKLSDLLQEEYQYLWCIPDVNIENFDESDIEIVRLFCHALENKQIYLNKQAINRYLQKLAGDYNYKFPALMKLIRQVLSGLQTGPSVADMLIILGKDNSLLRLRMFVEKSEAKMKRSTWGSGNMK
ncbi:nondiscriminating glutamyl-tRNA synthetase EARS2, mitochondrial [Atheta coriaria]|uniref:nondiscriminating glutamyl-tRNA synthetase EARS2, mitochondrial n=1 Tax=Dalotia coriaria TaxID=877792 RepID=UPI0031F44091